MDELYYLKKSTAERKTLAVIAAYYEANPDTMMKFGDTLLRAALDETPGGLQGKSYLDALEARKEAIARVTAEIKNYDAVLMTGPTSIMHFCGLPTVTVAGGKKNADGVNEAVRPCATFFMAAILSIMKAMGRASR